LQQKSDRLSEVAGDLPEGLHYLYRCAPTEPALGFRVAIKSSVCEGRRSSVTFCPQKDFL
jgi:hypothetical protein